MWQGVDPSLILLGPRGEHLGLLSNQTEETVEYPLGWPPGQNVANVFSFEKITFQQQGWPGWEKPL